MTKRRDLVLLLTKNGFWSVGGTRHEKFTNGKVTVLVKRHRESRRYSCAENTTTSRLTLNRRDRQ